MITLKTAIIHSFEKKAHTESVSDVVKKDTVLDMRNPALKELVEGINSLIGKDGNSVVYGQFADDSRQEPFPARFSVFIDEWSNEAEFVELTHLAMDQLVEQAESQTLATGGHILCAQYISSASNFFLVASIKQGGAIQLDENYVPKSIQELDLKTIQQAARISKERFVSVTEVDTENEAVKDAKEVDSTYLCFISRGRDSKVSDYFTSALGCAKGVASGRATKNAIDHVSHFFRDNEKLKSSAYDASESVICYLQKQFKDGKPARLDEICHVAIKHISADLLNETAGLKDYLNDESRRVPENFTVHSRSLNEKTKIKGKADNWTLQFERSALGQKPQSEIYYDKSQKKLTLSKMSEKLIKLIEQELKTRNE